MSTPACFTLFTPAVHRDGTVREWDATVASEVATLSSCGKAALCLDVSLGLATVASGHSDHNIRLWDARSKGGAPTGTLPHKVRTKLASESAIG